MTGLRTLLGGATRRAGVGLALAAAVILLAPVAAATPESDADAAINQAWDAGGGATGLLGPKDGTVYPVGSGFGQNFAGGKVFFTPDTGAHIMVGAILDKYMAVGGPADGDLGFPTIDEGAGKAPNSRNTTFSAADNPVIFFTPDTGARVVRGAINAAWDKLGGSAGPLGVPTDDEVYDGDVSSQNFSGGQLSWNSKTKVFTTTPPELADQLAGLVVPGDATSVINAARRAAGGPLGPLGAAQGPPTKVGADGLVQNFAGGQIFYSPDTGASVVAGQVLAKYQSVGGPEGDLGFPTGSEADGGLAPMSRIATFSAADKPVIFWTPDFGAVIVRGAMNAAWGKLGGATGALGAPTADQTENGDVVTQKFSGGAISWNKKTRAFSTEPANLASALSGLEVPGQDAPKAPPAAEPSSDGGSKWYATLRRWWWLAAIPVVLVVAAVVAAAVWNRRRGDDRAPLNQFDDYEDHEDHGDHGHLDFESGPVPLAERGAVGDDAYAPLSAWSVRSSEEGHGEPADRHADSADAEDGGDPDNGPTARMTGFPDDQDSIDTAPTRIEAESLTADVPAEEPAEEPEPASGPPSGRHAAIVLEEPTPGQTALRLAHNGPYHAPEGYPVKADTTTGVYWTPESDHYDRARAEIWFASEEFALTNGFVKG
ncbi:MAG: hypothetical protein QOK02_2174 [Mycobacterium sp.]|jgi:uncharacterized protein with LGFP repeats|nr:hypothetical protein [Mycobacterium sp.]